MRRTLSGAACLLAAALLLSACGEIKTQINPTASKAQSLTLVLPGPPSAAEAGIDAARSDGALSRAGINLRIITAAGTDQALAVLRAGRADVALTSEPEIMFARNRHEALASFGAVTQGPQATLVSITRRKKQRALTSVRALRGLRVGVSGSASEATLLDTMLHHAGVPQASVHRVDVSANPTAALLSGRVAAYYGTDAATVAAALRARHKRVTLLPPSRLGLPRYDGLVLATRVDYFAAHTNLLRRFVQALGRGYEAVRRDPGAGVSALRAARPSLTSSRAKESLTALLPDLFPAGGHPWGWQDQSAWNAFGRFLTGQGVISAPGAWVRASTNQLLAGQGP